MENFFGIRICTVEDNEVSYAVEMPRQTDSLGFLASDVSRTHLTPLMLRFETSLAYSGEAMLHIASEHQISSAIHGDIHYAATASIYNRKCSLENQY